VTKNINFNLLVNEYFRKSFLFFLTNFYSTYKLARRFFLRKKKGSAKKAEWNKIILRNSTKLGRIVSFYFLFFSAKKKRRE